MFSAAWANVHQLGNVEHAHETRIALRPGFYDPQKTSNRRKKLIFPHQIQRRRRESRGWSRLNAVMRAILILRVFLRRNSSKSYVFIGRFPSYNAYGIVMWNIFFDLYVWLNEISGDIFRQMILATLTYFIYITKQIYFRWNWNAKILNIKNKISLSLSLSLSVLCEKLYLFISTSVTNFPKGKDDKSV